MRNKTDNFAFIHGLISFILGITAMIFLFTALYLTRTSENLEVDPHPGRASENEVARWNAWMEHCAKVPECRENLDMWR